MVPDPPPPSTATPEYIKALVSSYQIAAPVMAHFYHLIGLLSLMDFSCCSEMKNRTSPLSRPLPPLSDAELDQQLTGSGLLLSTLLQNTVQGCRGPEVLAVGSEGPYDFYQQPNMSEARLCLPVLEQMREAVKHRLEDWPEHPALVQVRARLSGPGPVVFPCVEGGCVHSLWLLGDRCVLSSS